MNILETENGGLPMTTLYEAEAQMKSQGAGKASHVHSSDGRLDLTVANPLKYQKVENATNPEQILAAGFSACLENALVVQAGRSKTNFMQMDIATKVSIASQEDGTFPMKVRMQVGLPELNRDEALKLLEEGQKIWPFANANAAGIQIEIELVDRVSPVI